MSKRANAFTIVELLIVIVVIAILAAISIVAYNGIQDRANNTSAQAAASQASKAIALYFAQHETYPQNLSDVDINDPDKYSYTYNNTTNPKTFCVTATTSRYSYYASNVVSNPVPGGCPGHAQGGASAVTNYALYPNFAGSGSVASGWSTYSTGTTAGSRSVSGNEQTISATSLTGRIGILTSTAAAHLPVVNANEKYLSARLAVNTSQLASGLRLRLHIDGYNGSTHVRSFIQTTTATNATELVVPPTLITGSINRLEIVIYKEVTGSSWSGTSTVRVSNLAIYITDSSSFTPVYRDGNSPNWIWNGSSNASTSTGPIL